ncbi:MAG: hypothetical protein AMXMBFR82_02920 [Candidatus Hydrogenedentota bacterium]
MSSPDAKTPSLLKPLLLLVAVAVLFLASQAFPIAEWMRAFLTWVDALGPLAPIALGIAYILACVFLVPGWILTLGAGFLFGVIRGTVVISISATLGATAAFLVGRYLARNAVARRIAGNARFEAVDRAVAREGWKIVGLTRLSPLFPFNLLNYAFGLTQVSLKAYFFASWIGMLPGTILYVYIGSLAGDLATLGTGERQRNIAQWVLYGFGLVVTIVVTVYVTRIARAALRTTIDGDHPTTTRDR